MYNLRESIKHRSPCVTGVVRWLYDLLNAYRSRPAFYLPRAPFLSHYHFNRVLFDGRGNHPTQHLARTKRFVRVKDADVLVEGCRYGEEVQLWLSECPQSLIALDYSAFPEAWHSLNRRYLDRRLTFLSADARHLPFDDGEFDVVCSNNVLEHINPAGNCIDEMYRVLRPGGVMYASFLPLFWTFGGAHFEGAFEHLLLSPQAFYEWIVKRSRPLERAECLHYLEHDMFSYWTLDQYLDSFRQFERLYSIVHLSPGAYRYRQSHPKEWQALRTRYAEKELLVSGLTIWLRKPTQTDSEAAC